MTNLTFITIEDRIDLVNSIERVLGTSVLEDADVQSFLTDILASTDCAIGIVISMAMNKPNETAWWNELFNKTVDTATSNVASLDKETVDIIKDQVAKIERRIIRRIIL